VRTIAIVQARLRSERLPAKVLLDLGGATALQRCLDRATGIANVSEVVVACSDRPEDELIVATARRLGFRTFRGSEMDVLGRFYGAAREGNAEAIVRLTSDCPLLDPELSGDVVAAFLASQGGDAPVAYASNVMTRRLPRGLDTEILRTDALEEAHRMATRPEEREHVTAYLYRNPLKFRLLDVSYEPADLSHHRWTLDTLEDYRLLFAIYERLGPSASEARLRDVLGVLEREPDLVKINAAIEQKPT